MAEWTVPLAYPQGAPVQPRPRAHVGMRQSINDLIHQGIQRYGGPHLGGALLGTQAGNGQPARGGMLQGMAELSPAADVRDMLQGSGELMQGALQGRGWDAAQGAGLLGAATLGTLLPGSAGGYRQAAEEVAEEVAPTGIRAYHGSPHSFDEFSTEHIGKGEGAQAYGHGLYFAEAEDAARAYRDALERPMVGGQSVYTGDFSTAAQEAIWQAAESHGAKSTDDVADFLQSRLDELGDMLPYSSARTYRETISELREAGNKPVNLGSMYEVNIRANPEEFLDWDAPLSEQPENVRGVLSGIYADDALGSDIARQMADDARTGAIERGQTAATTLGASQEAAAESLRGLGIPGIRYYDQLSRDAAEGTRNYVVFDDALIDIIRKYGLAGALATGAVAGSMGQPSEAQAKGLANYPSNGVN